MSSTSDSLKEARMARKRLVGGESGGVQVEEGLEGNGEA
jgi:hypothetical protein